MPDRDWRTTDEKLRGVRKEDAAAWNRGYAAARRLKTAPGVESTITRTHPGTTQKYYWSGVCWRPIDDDAWADLDTGRIDAEAKARRRRQERVMAIVIAAFVVGALIVAAL